MMLKKGEIKKLNVDSINIVLKKGQSLLQSKYQAHVNTAFDLIIQTLNQYTNVKTFQDILFHGPLNFSRNVSKLKI